MNTEWRLEQRHNFEPGAIAPQFRWGITTKSHEDTMPRTVAFVAVKTDAQLATAAPIMLEALECWKGVFTTHAQGKPAKRRIDQAWKLTAQALHAAVDEETKHG